MKQHDIFNSLTRNAFDFLERGIDEFDRAPKYSVIQFCAAVEMLLKARLMKEHWSLIVSKPEQANLAKFMAGDFASVTMDEARARIRDIAGEDIADDALNSFRALANHRNKMIHFFHADVDGDVTEIILDGTLSRLEPGYETNAGLLLKLLLEDQKGVHRCDRCALSHCCQKSPGYCREQRLITASQSTRLGRQL